MKSYDYTLITLDNFYEDCKAFWIKQGQGGRAAHFLAMTDVMAVDNDPFSPNGEPLDPVAKADFIALYDNGQEM